MPLVGRLIPAELRDHLDLAETPVEDPLAGI